MTRSTGSASSSPAADLDSPARAATRAGARPLPHTAPAAGPGAQLVLRLADADGLDDDVVLPVIGGRAVRGGFGGVTVDADGYRATPLHTRDGLAVRLTPY